jgi:type VI secretion system protein ImpA
VAELEVLAVAEDDGAVAAPLSAAVEASPAIAAEPEASAESEPAPIAEPAPVAELIAPRVEIDSQQPEFVSEPEAEFALSAEIETVAEPEPDPVDPAVIELCAPLSESDPCGPDLDLAGDAEYLNFFAQTEGMLPSVFFSAEDGKPFDRSTVDLPRQIEAIKPLWERTRDLRLLVLRARLSVLDRNLGGFAISVAAIAQWMENFWDVVHPRGTNGDVSARAAALGALDLPTVIFPLQYAPLCEGRRIGAVTYRAWMIAIGEVKSRAGEQRQPSAALSQAVGEAPTEVLAATRRHIRMLKASLGRIRDVFAKHGSSAGLENLPALVDKIQAFVDPRATMSEKKPVEGKSTAPAGDAPASLADAKQALAAIAAYYSRSEPSSPALPLVRQAHQLIGKSFFEVMSILVPAQMEKAAFQIGADQFFELPVNKLSKLPESATPAAAAAPGAATATSNSGKATQYRVTSRAQAISLLEQVQQFFRHAEPSSPVPMLCERARAFAERDFMGVLREVLPKAALKTIGAEK